MSVTKVSSPETWSRVWDTNRMTYIFSSSNYTQPNFQYQFVLYYWDISTQIPIGTFNLFPNSGGTCEFNPSVVYKSFISYDYNASDTVLKECFNGARKFSMSVYEYYGLHPVRIIAGAWTGEVGGGTPLNVYNGCQQNIPYDYATLNSQTNYKWVMNTINKGKFLTDATEFRMCNTDIGFLYFNAISPQRPTSIRYTVYYNCVSGGLSTVDSSQLGISGELMNRQSNNQPLPVGSPYYILDEGSPSYPSYISISGVCDDVRFDSDLIYTSNQSLQFRFPMGPYQLIKTAVLSDIPNDWLYYKIDLMSGNTTMNSDPFYVFNTCKSEKYGKWSLSWLNRHGGFDNYTFDRKTKIEYKIKKDTYKQKLPPNPGFSTYDAGERIFNVQTTQEITLRSDLLSQKEAQILTQLVSSPRVYVNTIYQYNGVEYPYGVPCIVATDSIVYEQKKNDKEITMEIKIRYANDVVVQND